MPSIPRTQLAVIQVLLSGRTHAYEVKRQLAPDLGHSSIYAALAAAEAKGFLTSEWEDPNARPRGSGPLRKYYELTAEGRRALTEAQRAMAADTRRSGRQTGLSGATS